MNPGDNSKSEELSSGIIEVNEEAKKASQKSGWLVKQGGKWRTWRKRYFVLKENHLYYFKEIKDLIPKGVILLDGVKVVEENLPFGPKRKFCFALIAKKSFTAEESWNNRTYYLQAQKDEEKDEWIKVIRRGNPGNRTPNTGQLDTNIQKLFRACGEGDLKQMKQILEYYNFDFGVRDEEGNTLLHWACVSGNTEVVSFLLQNQGVDIEATSKDGFTPMHSVTQGDYADVLRLLIEKGAKVDTPNTSDNFNTTLHYSACWGAVECTKVLLASGATVDALAQDKSTPLCFAAEKGHLAIATLLVDAGANVEAKNDPEEKGGATPLLLAAHNGHTDVLEYLIGKKAHVTEKTIDGLNALHLAIRSGSDNDLLVKMLVDAGTPINGKTNSGDTPLHYSSYMGYIKSATLLINRGASLEEKGQNDSTPLHFAAREGQIELVKLLLSKGAKVDSKDRDGDTPFQCAMINEHMKCAEYLKSSQQ